MIFISYGDEPGPQPKPAATINIPNKCGPQLATLRSLGPSGIEILLSVLRTPTPP